MSLLLFILFQWTLAVLKLVDNLVFILNDVHLLREKSIFRQDDSPYKYRFYVKN